MDKEGDLLERFGDLMDELIESNHVKLMIDSPEGTQNVTVKDNMGLGGAVQLFFLLKAMTPIYKDIYDTLLDYEKHEDFIDGVLALVKDELMDATRKEE